MFHRILVPLSGRRIDEAGIEHAHALAISTGAEVCLVHVVGPAPGEAGHPVDPFAWRARKLEGTRYLQEVGERWREAGLDARSILLEGDPGAHIVDSVLDQDADLVVLCSGRHGRGVIGDVVHQVLQRASCSALVLGPDSPACAQAGLAAGPRDAFRYRRILVPLDGSVRAECVLPVVTAVARTQGADLILGHVVPEPEMPRRTPPTEEDLALARRLTERNLAEAALYLEGLRERLGGRTELRLVTHHSVPASLHTIAESEGVDLVAMCAHGYSGDARWACGSVASNFIGYGSAPLLLVQDLARPRASHVEPPLVSTRAPLRCSLHE